MSTGWKQKPNSSRSVTALLVAHRSVILAGRRELQQSSDWNHRFGRVADQNAQISSSFCDFPKVKRKCGNMECGTSVPLSNAAEPPSRGNARPADDACRCSERRSQSRLRRK